MPHSEHPPRNLPSRPDRRAAIFAGLKGALGAFGLGSTGLFSPTVHAAETPEALGALRFLKVRHATFLVELGDLRVLFDPWFSRPPLSGVVLSAPPPSPEPDALGKLDLLLLTSAAWDRFDPFSLRALVGRQTYCFVPSERCASTLRSAGFSRVRVTTAGDSWRHRGTLIEVSPAGEGVGYRLQRGGRTLWNTGPLVPLDVDAATIPWLRRRPSEVVMSGWDPGPGSRLGTALGKEDAVLLGRLARARFLVPQGDEVRPTGAYRVAVDFVLGSDPEPAHSPGGPRVIKPERGLWYRVARQSTRQRATLTREGG